MPRRFAGANPASDSAQSPADRGPRQESVEKSSERREQVWMITKWFGPAVLLGHQRVQEKQRPAGYFTGPADKKPFEVVRAPSQDKFLMCDIVVPLAGFSQKPFRIARCPIQKNW